MPPLPRGSSGTCATSVTAVSAAESTGAKLFAPRCQSRAYGAHRGCAVRPTADSPSPSRGPDLAFSNRAPAADRLVRVVIGESTAAETIRDATAQRCQAGRVSGRCAIASRARQAQPRTGGLVCDDAVGWSRVSRRRAAVGARHSQESVRDVHGQRPRASDRATESAPARMILALYATLNQPADARR